MLNSLKINALQKRKTPTFLNFFDYFSDQKNKKSQKSSKK